MPTAHDEHKQDVRLGLEGAVDHVVESLSQGQLLWQAIGTGPKGIVCCRREVEQEYDTDHCATNLHAEAVGQWDDTQSQPRCQVPETHGAEVHQKEHE